MSRCYHARRAWLGDGLGDGMVENVLIETDGHHVTAVTRDAEPGAQGCQIVDFAGPALSDLQVNGCGGVMLNSAPTARTIAHMVATQRARGTGWILPTLITCETERMQACVDAAIEAWGLPGFLGLHLEGPHLNLARRGTHKADHIRPFEPATMAMLARLRAAAIPVMLTLAPECVAPEVIAELTALGVVVSGGHSAADAAQTQAALEAGMRCFTHLYNAMPAMESRRPGILGTAIGSSAHAGIIVDGHHVAYPMVALACRARPVPGRMFMVSDAMATIGGPDVFELYGEQIRVRDGALINAEGALAGAHVDLLGCLQNAVRHVGLPFEEAYAMAAMIPRDAMGLPRPVLAPGMALAELLCLDAALERVV